MLHICLPEEHIGILVDLNKTLAQMSTIAAGKTYTKKMREALRSGERFLEHLSYSRYS